LVEATGQRSRVFEFGPFRLDVDGWRLSRDGEPVALEPRVFALLVLLVERRGELLTKSEVIARLWQGIHVEERTLTQHVYVLRKALGPTGHQYIQNVPRKGYRFAGEVRIIEPATAPAPEAASVPLPVVTAPMRRWSVGWLSALPAVALVVWGLARVGPGQAQAEVPLLQKLTSDGIAQLSAIAPDGNTVAYTRTGPHGESLYLLSTDGSPVTELARAAGARHQGLTFSPDSKWLYYVRDFQLSRVRLDDGRVEALLRGVDRPVSFAPDGRRFAFVSEDVARAESAISIAAADGTSARIVTVRKKPMFYRAVAWSPSGDVIAASGGYEGHRAMEVVTIDVASGRERPLGASWPHVGEIGWRPDGAALNAIVRYQPAAFRQVVEIAYPSGDYRPVTRDLDDYRSLSVSRHGVLATVQAGQQSNLWMIGENAAARELTSGTGDDQNPVWLSDTVVVYQHRNGGARRINSLDLASGAIRSLTPAHCDSSAPAGTPDGRSVVFVSACTGPPALWSMRADGSGLRQLTSGGGDNHPSVSADGTWVYYEALEDGKPIVKKVPLAGGKSGPVTARLSRMPVASPGSDWLASYYWNEEGGSPARIALMAASSGAVIGSLPLNPARRWPFMRWSPDGASLVTVGRDGDPHNLWSYPVDGSAPRVLTAFSDALETYSFAWSRSNARLIVARGRSRDDVVLIRR
jgi:DNA-binding winged helix-turn-helix (wHTH) protein/Tol biopolymer transport system component